MNLIGIIGTAVGVVVIILLLLFFVLVFVAILKQVRMMNQNLVRMAERIDLRTKQDQVLLRYLQHYELQLSRWYNYTTGLQWEFGDTIIRPPNSPGRTEDERNMPIDDELLMERERRQQQDQRPSARLLVRQGERAKARRREL